MDNKKEKIETIDAYIAQYEPGIQKVLNELRKTIRETAPDAAEKISWAMPTFHYRENLVHFAVHKNHIGFYPGADGIEQFADAFDRRNYKYSKGAVQFPLSAPLPLELVKDIVRYRVNAVNNNL